MPAGSSRARARPAHRASVGADTRRRPITQLRPLLAPALIDMVVTLTRTPRRDGAAVCAGYGCARGVRRRRAQRRGGVRDLLGYLITGLDRLHLLPRPKCGHGVGSPSSAAAAGPRGVEQAAPGRRGTLRVSWSSSSPTDTPLKRPGQQRLAVIRPAGTRLQGHKSLNPGQKSPSGLPDVSWPLHRPTGTCACTVNGNS